MWPNYRQIRSDKTGEGMLLQFHDKLKLEEVTGLQTEVAGMWLVVSGGMMDKEKMSVIGMVVGSKDDTVLGGGEGKVWYRSGSDTLC